MAILLIIFFILGFFLFSGIVTMTFNTDIAMDTGKTVFEKLFETAKVWMA